MKKIHRDDLGGLIRAGGGLFLPGSTGELDGALLASLDGVSVISALISGINSFDVLTGAADAIGFFPLPSGMATPCRLIRSSYYGIDAHIARLRPNVAVFQVTPPHADGTCTTGVAFDFVETALKGAMVRVAIVNPRLPELRGSPRLPLEAFTHIMEAEAVPLELPDPPPDPAAARIADQVAALIPDHAVIQIGIGKIPAQVIARLTSRRGLRLHSGILPQGIRELFEAGALATDDPVVTASLVGDAAFYDWLRGRAGIRLAPVCYTHAPATLNCLGRLFAVNSAIEVDLQGNVNSEYLRGRVISAPGGLPDFAPAAQRCQNGCSIIAMPATDGSGRYSRIVSKLDAPATVAGTDVDLIVTEHGVADLRGEGAQMRRNRLIAIAAPIFRDSLTSASPS